MNRAEEIQKSIEEIGKEATAKKFGITKATVERYSRRVRNQEPKELFSKSQEAIFQELLKQFTVKELQAMANSYQKPSKNISLNYDVDVVKIGVISDTHIGSIYFSEDWYFEALERFHKENCNLILHAGDVTEGMSNRPDQVYSLNKIGYTAQKDYAVDLFSESDIPIKAIDGNHDRWFIKNSGAMIVKDIADRLDNFEFIGHDEGDLYINGVLVRLWHGEDGASYAHSYRPQKIVESFYGGEKPQVLILGHSHKAIWQFDRNIQTISAGSLSKQSKWMRSKRISAHTGYYILEIESINGEIKSFTPRFFPFYI